MLVEHRTGGVIYGLVTDRGPKNGKFHALLPLVIWRAGCPDPVL
jgi:hypothetical protein